MAKTRRQRRASGDTVGGQVPPRPSASAVPLDAPVLREIESAAPPPALSAGGAAPQSLSQPEPPEPPTSHEPRHTERPEQTPQHVQQPPLSAGKDVIMPDIASEISEVQQQAQQEAEQVVDRVVNSMKGSVENGLRMQEEVTRFWSKALAQDGIAQRFADSSRQMVDNAMPQVKNNTQQCLKLIDEGYKRNRELIQKALDPSEYRFLFDGLVKAQDHMASAMAAWRNQAVMTLQVMNQLAHGWGDALERNADVARDRMKDAARAGDQR
jgi:hypothetical protein